MERFDEYVERCLYDPTAGFYASGRGVAGRRSGDFITSPEVGPLFGAVIANALDAWWVELGRPNPYVVVDAGAGPGSLLRAITRAEPKCLDALSTVEVDPSLGTELPIDLTGAVVLANELLDNLPFRVLVKGDESWFEVFIDGGREVTRPVSTKDLPDVLPADVVAGSRAPVLGAANDYVTTLLARGAARVLVFDYGAMTTNELVARGGWLRTYREHQRGSDPLVEPGQWDITTDIAVDQLPTPAESGTQAEFLKHWGIDRLVAEGVAYWTANAAAPTLHAMLMRSRVAEAEALLQSDGLGGWLWLLWKQDDFRREQGVRR